MRSKRKIVSLNDFEQKLLVRCLMTARNAYLYESKPTEDINGLIVKIIDASTRKLRILGKETD